MAARQQGVVTRLQLLSPGSARRRSIDDYAGRLRRDPSRRLRRRPRAARRRVRRDPRLRPRRGRQPHKRCAPPQPPPPPSPSPIVISVPEIPGHRPGIRSTASRLRPDETTLGAESRHQPGTDDSGSRRTRDRRSRAAGGGGSSQTPRRDAGDPRPRRPLPGPSGDPALRDLLDAGSVGFHPLAGRAPLSRHDAEGEAPRARVNAHLGAFEVDFLWTEQRVAVEIDGYEVSFHTSRPSQRSCPGR